MRLFLLDSGAETPVSHLKPLLSDNGFFMAGLILRCVNMYPGAKGSGRICTSLGLKTEEHSSF